ncbi:hypothetical protein CONCODRAFT_11736 [Conidiobolus coronatus NRRL 28638]|uniref:G-protein coupled receptors family 1 profile domain-containing protein n=1 Tax=Conidiobolus coronatus (strain ATCC 28846 / CBS 209.66 / NRRL 28638) TaxID=796925 RepID=A0A137NUM9_CONC2|nr:hypothetical protein CONCODRAFT_11736 [Conidiobolus coronatus NRRL 28638]|eukprot:KXN66428.1 hypothetical protein CONCODRAFT_11736 [Conidiobolus coronatus NRRL 28638]
MSALNCTIYTLELLKNLLSFILNSFVLYITVHKFKLKGVDICVSFILCTIDVLFCLHNSTHIILHAITNSEINQNPTYIKVYFGIYWILATIGFDCLITLGIVRYLAICKNYLVKRRTAIFLVLACSLIPVVLSIVMPVIATAKNNSNQWGDIYPTLNLTDNYLTKPMGIFISLSSYIYLMVLVFCYCNISLYYYKSLGLLQLQTYSSQDKRLEGYYNNESKTRKVTESRSHNNSEFPEIPNTTKKLIKSQKLITCLKYSVVIVVFICEILPMSVMHTIIYFYPIPRYTVWDTVCTYLFHCIPLTNPCFILFLHLDTFQEFKFLMRRIRAKFEK